MVTANLGLLAGVGRILAEAEPSMFRRFIFDYPTPQRGAWLGQAVAEAGDINDEGIPGLLIREPEQDRADSPNQSLACVFNGASGRWLRDIHNLVAGGNGLGTAVAGLGDTNGDGTDDCFLVVVPQQTVDGQGQVFLVHGSDGPLASGCQPPSSLPMPRSLAKDAALRCDG